MYQENRHIPDVSDLSAYFCVKPTNCETVTKDHFTMIVNGNVVLPDPHTNRRRNQSNWYCIGEALLKCIEEHNDITPTKKLPSLEQTGLQLSRKIIRSARNWIATTDIAGFLGKKSMQEISTTNPSALFRSLQPIYQGMCKDFRILELCEGNWGAREAVRQCLLNDKAGKTKGKATSNLARTSRSRKSQPCSTKGRVFNTGEGRKQNKPDVLKRDKIESSKSKRSQPLRSRTATPGQTNEMESSDDEFPIKSYEQADKGGNIRKDQKQRRLPSTGRISKKSPNQRKITCYIPIKRTQKSGTCSSAEENETLPPSDESDGEHENPKTQRTKFTKALNDGQTDSSNSDDNILPMRINSIFESNAYRLDGSGSSKNSLSPARSKSDFEDEIFNSEDEALPLRILKAKKRRLAQQKRECSKRTSASNAAANEKRDKIAARTPKQPNRLRFEGNLHRT